MSEQKWKELEWGKDILASRMEVVHHSAMMFHVFGGVELESTSVPRLVKIQMVSGDCIIANDQALQTGLGERMTVQFRHMINVSWWPVQLKIYSMGILDPDPGPEVSFQDDLQELLMKHGFISHPEQEHIGEYDE